MARTGCRPAQSHPLLEVMVEIIPPDTLVIFHVIGARAKHLDRLKDRPD